MFGYKKKEKKVCFGLGEWKNKQDRTKFFALQDFFSLTFFHRLLWQSHIVCPGFLEREISDSDLTRFIELSFDKRFIP